MSRITLPALIALTATSLALLSACTANPRRDHHRFAEPAPSTRPAPILHVVFVRLKDPLDVADAARESLEAVAQMPFVTTAFAGLPLETGREEVVRDYDFCFTLGFQTREDLRAYEVHSAHTALLDRWRDRIEWIRIHDSQDVRP